MWKIIFFTVLIVFALPAYAGNLLINPGFDETPWDTGWTVEIISGVAYAESDTIYYSSPRSCRLTAYHYHTTEPWGEVSIYQEIDSVRSCTCRVYLETEIKQGASGGGIAKIFVKVNGGWVEEWFTIGNNPIWTVWGKIYDSTDVVNGILFFAGAYTSLNGFVAKAQFWIDDVYIGGASVGIEENRKQIVKYLCPQISSNPANTFFTIRSQAAVQSIMIYDVSGRLIKKEDLTEFTKEKQISLKGISSGVYFLKVNTEEAKFIKKLIVTK